MNVYQASLNGVTFSPKQYKRKTTALFASLVWYVITEIGMSKKADNIKVCMGTCLFAYVHAIFFDGKCSLLFSHVVVSDLPSVPKYIVYCYYSQKNSQRMQLKRIEFLGGMWKCAHVVKIYN